MKHTPTLALLFAALLGVSLLMPLPFHGRVADAVGDLIHAPAFAVLAALVMLAFRRLQWAGRWTTSAVWIVLVGLGGLMEIVQLYVGRGPSWGDLWADALGVTAGMLWPTQLASERVLEVHDSDATRERVPGVGHLKRRTLCAVLLIAAELPASIVLADCTRQWLAMPEIASFEQAMEMTRWSGHESQLERVQRFATEGEHALEVRLMPGVFPGVQMHWPPPDWTGYQELVFDIRLDNGAPLSLLIKIHDRQHWRNGVEVHDRFEQWIELHPGLQQVRISLSDVEVAPRDRRMNLRDIVWLQLFAVDLREPRTLVLDHVRLE